MEKNSPLILDPLNCRATAAADASTDSIEESELSSEPVYFVNINRD